MKKIAFLLLVNLLLVNYSLEAQTEKGKWILGSTLGVYNCKLASIISLPSVLPWKEFSGSMRNILTFPFGKCSPSPIEMQG